MFRASGLSSVTTATRSREMEMLTEVKYRYSVLCSSHFSEGLGHHLCRCYLLLCLLTQTLRALFGFILCFWDYFTLSLYRCTQDVHRLCAGSWNMPWPTLGKMPPVLFFPFSSIPPKLDRDWNGSTAIVLLSLKILSFYPASKISVSTVPGSTSRAETRHGMRSRGNLPGWWI